mmetsp:Transcript_9780/g.14360  ORF Transcript_9780/g.14360 Transcript_9780/m.14360 type:complete len:249 (+) Transcript_9780:1994-2740(+)
MPSFSFPSKRTVFFGNSYLSIDLLEEVCSKPTMVYPSCCLVLSHLKRSSSLHCSIGTQLPAPTLKLLKSSVLTTLISGITSRSAAKISAVRDKPPRFGILSTREAQTIRLCRFLPQAFCIATSRDCCMPRSRVSSGLIFLWKWWKAALSLPSTSVQPSPAESSLDFCSINFSTCFHFGISFSRDSICASSRDFLIRSTMCSGFASSPSSTLMLSNPLISHTLSTSYPPNDLVCFLRRRFISGFWSRKW